ncbi:general amino acid permease agp2 [Malassezia psittaci]|uniref:General amino acid permease agp2 n=1 Tax=Malassezia psittaci TaxID=1821823 RepID=A0AAF0FBU5_9BASI|nr:general amino acid permease agp2 [Malassezia psittaci]
MDSSKESGEEFSWKAGHTEGKHEVFLDDYDATQSNVFHEQEVKVEPRRLSARQVAVFSMAGSIGTNIFINTSIGLTKAGPISLIIGYLYLGSIIFCINICLSELVTFLPIRGSIHRFAGAFLDPAMGAASAINYWLMMVSMLCLEVNAFTSVLLYWVDAKHKHMLNILIPFLVIGSYFLLNIWDTRWFGEAEFWVGLCKVITALGLIVMTVFLMCGANPKHDAFGFRYWTDPGPMSEYLFSGAKGRFCSVLAAIVNAAWTFQGPDMVAIAAGEVRNPRVVVPRAFKTVYVRLTLFFIGSAIAVGILVPYNDAILKDAIENDLPGGSRTAWVRALNRLNIPGLPHIINAVILTSIYSAGNALSFAGSRSLLAMAMEGKLPKAFAWTNRNGVPYVSVAVTVSVGLLSFLQVSKGSSQALFYFIDISTSSLLVAWVIIAWSHLWWRRAIVKQNFDVNQLPYNSRFSPYASYYAIINGTLVLLICGWDIFVKGQWDTVTFILQYFALGLTVVVFLFYKLLQRTKFVKLTELEISHGVAELVAYEKTQETVEVPERKGRLERVLAFAFSPFF